MWAEFIFPRDDLARLLGEALPLTIHLGDAEKNHTLSLSELGDVTLVADLGLRVVCKAQLRWPLLGIDVPIEVTSLVIVLLPSIGHGPDGDTLVFRAAIEHAAFAALPALIDDRIRTALNSRLSAAGAELAWNFTKTLTCLLSVPSSIEPLESVSLRPAWGKVRISTEAIVCVASFHSAIVRRGESPPADHASPAETLAVPERSATPAPVVSKRLVAAGVLALGAGIAYLALRHVLRA